MKKLFKLPVTFILAGEVQVEAETLQEAIQLAYEGPNPDYSDCDYVSDSFRVEDYNGDAILPGMDVLEEFEESLRENDAIVEES